MIPALIVPSMHPELAARMFASVDVPVGRRIVIDNSGRSADPDAIRLPANLGVAASWNLGMKLAIDAPWWFITNDDVVFLPGTLAALVAKLADETPQVVCLAHGFEAFAINRAALETVGWFDENFHPAYCEDTDFEYRCRLAGVPVRQLALGLRHDRSATIKDDHYRTLNAGTYPRNFHYHVAKWGGNPRGGEVLASPFGQGAAPRDWTLDPRRLREQRWPRPNGGT